MDEDGYAHFSAIENLARRSGVSLEEANTAVDAFLSPDPNSGDPSNEGRRIERVPGGFIILNSPKYRAIYNKVIEREQTRHRVKRHRESKREPLPTVTLPLHPVTDPLPPLPISPSASASASATTETEANKKKGPLARAVVGVADWRSEIPESLRTEAFERTWFSWLEDLKLRKKVPTPKARVLQLGKCDKMGPEKAVAAIELSIERGWRSIFDGENNYGNNQSNSGNHSQGARTTPSEDRNRFIAGAGNGEFEATLRARGLDRPPENKPS
jgi:hypothetical protein